MAIGIYNTDAVGPGSHWRLLAVNFNARALVVCDPFGTTEKLIADALRSWK